VILKWTRVANTISEREIEANLRAMRTGEEVPGQTSGAALFQDNFPAFLHFDRARLACFQWHHEC
jgi:hypothetical protein